VCICRWNNENTFFKHTKLDFWNLSYGHLELRDTMVFDCEWGHGEEGGAGLTLRWMRVETNVEKSTITAAKMKDMMMRILLLCLL
jgi:hypothetical protein